RGDVVYGAGNAYFQSAVLEPEGELLPLVQKYRFVLDNPGGAWQLRIIDKATNKEAFPPIKNLQPGQFGSNTGFSSLAGIRMAQIHGHILLLTGQSSVAAFDVTTTGDLKKPLWSKEVQNKPPVNGQLMSSTVDANGVTTNVYADGTKVRLGVTG